MQVLLLDGELTHAGDTSVGGSAGHLASAATTALPPAVDIDTVAVFATKLSDEALLEHRSAEVADAIATWAASPCRAGA